jgi:AhpD family alkylhydroperoxidase
MEARMTNPAMIVPDALPALLALGKTVKHGGVPVRTLDLVALRASQLNGCAFCCDMHAREGRQHGATDEQLATLAVWREAPFFSDAERAALALTECLSQMTLAGVPDPVWAEAERHYDRPVLASLILAISLTNLWNRLNVATRQVAGSFRP